MYMYGYIHSCVEVCALTWVLRGHLCCLQVLKFVQTYSKTGPPAMSIAEMVSKITGTMKEALTLAKGAGVRLPVFVLRLYHHCQCIHPQLVPSSMPVTPLILSTLCLEASYRVHHLRLMGTWARCGYVGCMAVCRQSPMALVMQLAAVLRTSMSWWNHWLQHDGWMESQSAQTR